MLTEYQLKVIDLLKTINTTIQKTTAAIEHQTITIVEATNTTTKLLTDIESQMPGILE